MALTNIGEKYLEKRKQQSIYLLNEAHTNDKKLTTIEKVDKNILDMFRKWNV